MSPAAGSGVSECPNQLLARMLVKAMKAPVATMAALTPMRPGAVQALHGGTLTSTCGFFIQGPVTMPRTPRKASQLAISKASQAAATALASLDAMPATPVSTPETAAARKLSRSAVW
jgi:hypothetical protein